MRYLSVCSGIEAATQAFHPHGWTPVAFAEIEPFPCAVLKHHYPDVPNWGDMTKFKDWPDAAIDVLCGGTPCQSFSVAGLRQGLADPRGNLMLTFGAIAARYRPEWLVWENVPGVLSSNGGRDFAAFLSLLGQLGYGWAYRVLDAQHVRTRRFPHAVPQRRRRVFVVGHLGDWRRAAAVLFDRESLSGHPAPRRESGKIPAPTIAARTRGGGGLGTDFDCDGGLIAAEVAPTLNAHFGDKQGLEDQHINGGGDCSLPAVSMCLNAGAMGRIDAESETFIPTIGGGFDVAGTLLGNGFDGSPDGTGRGMQIVPVAPTLRAGGNATGGTRPYGTDVDTCDSLVPVPVAFTTEQTPKSNENCALTLTKQSPTGGGQIQSVAIPIAIQERAVSENPDNGPQGSGIRQDGAAYTLEARNKVQAVAFDCKGTEVQHSEGVTPPLRSMGHNHSHQNAGGHAAVAFDLRGREGGAMPEGPHDTANIRAASGGSSRSYVAQPWEVRRLTPRECERLQGFPDEFTRIPYRGKPADICPDGPRYKALGNSWAVNCADWLAERITIAAQWGQP